MSIESRIENCIHDEGNLTLSEKIAIEFNIELEVDINEMDVEKIKEMITRPAGHRLGCHEFKKVVKLANRPLLSK